MFRAYAADLDGRPLALAGIYFDQDRVIAFSQTRPEIFQYKIAIGYLIREVRKLMEGHTVFAMAENEDPEKSWLIRKLGFEQIEGRFYRWQNHR